MSEVLKLRKRNEIPDKYKWSIEKIYPDVSAWGKDFSYLKEILPEIKKYSGKLGKASELLAYLKLDEKISRLTEKLSVYTHLRSDEDTANTEYQALMNKMDMYIPEIKSAGAFFVPELLSLPEGTVQKEIEEEPSLKMYRFMLQNILKQKPHVLSKEKEELMAQVSDCLDGPSNIFNMLSNADMMFPVIKNEENQDVELTEGNYISFIRSRNREVREEAFKSLFNTYGKYKNTFAASLTSSMKNFIFKSKVRNYGGALESALEPNNIPTQVFQNTINTIDNNLESLHRYVKIKKKLLGLNDIHMYDLYVPLIDVPKAHIEFEGALKIAEEALKPLGKEYMDIFKSGIKEGWVDIYQNKGKASGAYSSGCYDTQPYVLLNYNYEEDDVSTLVHEMGHSIHSYYSKENQPYIYWDYSIFCAEVASTCNENLLIHYLIKNEKDKKRKLYLINDELEKIRTTIFRQAMFAEFEKITHENLEKGIPLTSEDLCRIWHELNARYFGEDMIIDKEIDMEWARIPHFYRDFYVYQYATGYAAAYSFASMMLEGGENSVERYKSFLKSGGSDYPINELKSAGVDMTTPEPLIKCIRRFNELLDMLENI